MRIPSGKTDIAIYFVAVDATDYVTREAGLSSFTVYRSRDGAAEVAYTTPTITEIDATNMPGVYALLIDEDTTIGAASDSEEYCVHITHAGMAPVTRTIELYRRTVTTLETLTVSSGLGSANATQISGSSTAADNVEVVFATDFATNYDTTLDRWQVDVDTWRGSAPNSLVSSRVDVSVGAVANNAITAAAIATGAIDADAIADNAIDAGAIATGAITSAKFAAGAITAAVIATDAIGADALAADAVAEINATVDTALADYDGPTNAEMVARTLASASYATAAAQTTAQNDLDLLTGADGAVLATSQPNYAPATAAALAVVNGIVDAIKLSTDNLPSDPADQSLIIAATDAILSAVADVPTNAELEARTRLAAEYATASDLATVDGVADAIKTKTDQLAFTDGNVNANIEAVNAISVNGEGTEANPWGP